ncbi:ARF GAP-like zinc finger-containing protein [Histomonas meleagridis]|uniref:ARF GAP-like zinc finger-containing protein n=1 Tax=Histomonas meleagridis TaxID=135588 RepID=UPI003559E397|nr:ARF GAP-like zinc finger-containing protein [Histomonas meleagridis]KAH0797008.1 ARF GAP-like zinc finger-containing protein [Histomonas meleagridis]
MSKNDKSSALKLVKELLTDPYNIVCADCQCKQSEWASVTLGVFICTNCSGVHRSLGTHISFVRSCTLDAWTMEQALLMKNVGNKIANSYWEANLPEDFERPNESNRSLMQLFIKQKYALKKWAANGTPPHLIAKTIPIELKVTQKQHHPKKQRERNANGKIRTNISPSLSAPAPAQKESEDTLLKEKTSSLDSFFSDLDQPRRTAPTPYKPHQRHAIDVNQSNLIGIDAFYAEDYFNRKNKINTELQKKKNEKNHPPPAEEQPKNINEIDLTDLNYGFDDDIMSAGFVDKPSQQVEPPPEPKQELPEIKFVTLDDEADISNLQNFFGDSSGELPPPKKPAEPVETPKPPKQEPINIINNTFSSEPRTQTTDIFAFFGAQKSENESEQSHNADAQKENQNEQFIELNSENEQNNKINDENEQKENQNEQNNKINDENEINQNEQYKELNSENKQNNKINDENEQKEENQNEQFKENEQVNKVNDENETNRNEQLKEFSNESESNEPNKAIQQIGSESNALRNENPHESQSNPLQTAVESPTNAPSHADDSAFADIYAFFESEYQLAREQHAKHSLRIKDDPEHYDAIDDFFIDAEMNMFRKQPKNATKRKHRKAKHAHAAANNSSNAPARSSLAPVQRKPGNYIPKRLQKKLEMNEPKKPKRHRHHRS